MTRAALVSMPFGPIGSPSIALGLLQSIAQGAGHEARCFYFNVAFANELGVRDYTALCEGSPSTISMAGEWVFSLNAMSPVDFLKKSDPSLKPEAIAAIEPAMAKARALAPEFLIRAAEIVSAYDPAIVGLTSVFQQTCGSLALARSIKARHPHVMTVMGGANVEDPMGSALLAAHPELDAVVSGEGEHAWLDVLEYVSHGTLPDRWSGLRLRGQHPQEKTRISVDLNELPDPVYGDYFDACLPDEVRQSVRLPFESSRGCWWGAKSHCIFCGLNGSSLQFRKKQPDRAEAELRRLVGRYPVQAVSAVDNIIPHDYFHTLLPALAANPIDKPVFYETKANLNASQVNTLARAGIDRIQPGIENLSDDVLKLMRKGITGCQNVSLLRECRNSNVGVEWNYLWGFPGECSASYEFALGMLPTLHHLEPPSGWGRLRIDRFSPLHAEPAAHGLANLKAVPCYRLLFPGLSSREADRLAYYFNADFLLPAIDDELAGRVSEGLKNWKAGYETSALVYTSAKDHILIMDVRNGAGDGQFIALAGTLAQAFELLLSPLSPAVLAERLGIAIEPAQLLIAELVNRRLVVRIGKTCVNVCNKFETTRLPEPAAKRLHGLISKMVADRWTVQDHLIAPSLDPHRFGSEIGFLLNLDAAAVPHGGRSLFDHLVAVANRLNKQSADRETVVAGLFHSVYGSQRVFPLLDKNSGRDQLANSIGAGPEHLVYNFSTRDIVPVEQPKRQTEALEKIHLANAEDIQAFLGMECAAS